MTAEPSPKQALFLWKMITARTLEEREPVKSKATPRLAPRTELQTLIDQGYLSTDKRGRAQHLILTDKAWAWAERNHDVTLMRSNSKVGAVALEGLLRRLLPFLAEREIPLASLFTSSLISEQEHDVSTPASSDVESTPAPLTARIERACLELADGQRKRRVRLSALRDALGDVRKNELDEALLALQEAGRAVLYRDDNSAGLTAADHDAALFVGGAPRHIIYLEA
jgi:hypothetical protein